MDPRRPKSWFMPSKSGNLSFRGSETSNVPWMISWRRRRRASPRCGLHGRSASPTSPPSSPTTTPCTRAISARCCSHVPGREEVASMRRTPRPRSRPSPPICSPIGRCARARAGFGGGRRASQGSRSGAQPLPRSAARAHRLSRIAACAAGHRRGRAVDLVRHRQRHDPAVRDRQGRGSGEVPRRISDLLGDDRRLRRYGRQQIGEQGAVASSRGCGRRGAARFRRAARIDRRGEFDGRGGGAGRDAERDQPHRS